MSASPPTYGPLTRSQTRGRGAITSLPTELLLAVLSMLLNECADMLGRQQVAQRFLRVNRAFHLAYRLSPSAHECAITSLAHAASLTSLLMEPGTHSIKVRRLWLQPSDASILDKSVGAKVGRLVAACGGQLSRFDWEAETWLSSSVHGELVQAWTGCRRMEESEGGARSRGCSCEGKWRFKPKVRPRDRR